MEEIIRTPQAEGQDELFSAEEAADIARQDALPAPEKTPMQRAAERILSVSRQRRAAQNGADWEGLFRRFPEAGASPLPQEVFAAVRQGSTPVEAYQQQRIRQLELQMQSERSARRSVGPAAGEGSPVGYDPFLHGLDQ